MQRKRAIRTNMAAIENAARRHNAILKLLESGKTREKAMQAVGSNPADFSSDLKILRGGFKTRPKYFPPKYVHKWNPKRTRQLIEYAKKVIEGKIRVKKRELFYPNTLSRQQHRGIIARLIKNPVQSDAKIAAEVGVRHYFTVERRRRKLEAEGKIRLVSLSERAKLAQREEEKKTDALNEEKRKKFLEKHWKRIQGKANTLYYKNRKAFDFQNTLPEEIADELKERLDWKLQTFNPKRMHGPEETKLARYFSKKPAQVAFDLKRTAWRQYREIASLEAGMEEKKDIKRTMQAPTIFKDITVAQLEALSKALKLNLMKEAVLFGTAAGIRRKTVGKALGLSETRVIQIKKETEKKVEKAIGI